MTCREGGAGGVDSRRMPFAPEPSAAATLLTVLLMIPLASGCGGATASGAAPADAGLDARTEATTGPADAWTQGALDSWRDTFPPFDQSDAGFACHEHPEVSVCAKVFERCVTTCDCCLLGPGADFYSVACLGDASTCVPVGGQ